MLLGGMLKCAEHGYRMIFELVDTHNDHVERELGAAIAALQPDGVILTPPHSENPLITGFLAKRKIPFARIGSITSGPGIAMTMDDEGSARRATEHLIALGHSRIGFIAGPTENDLSNWRIDGWREAMTTASFSCDALCVRGDFGYDSGVLAANALLDLENPPTAIIGSNDQMTLAALDAAKTRGLSIPDDLSLISFDNTPVVRFTMPELTAVDQPIAATFSKAVELLITNGDALVPHQPIVIEGSLIERSSTASPPTHGRA
jgi:LacI family transcriptional regulator